jgi:hypothetical protein
MWNRSGWVYPSDALEWDKGSRTPVRMATTRRPTAIKSNYLNFGGISGL